MLTLNIDMFCCKNILFTVIKLSTILNFYNIMSSNKKDKVENFKNINENNKNNDNKKKNIVKKNIKNNTNNVNKENILKGENNIVKSDFNKENSKENIKLDNNVIKELERLNKNYKDKNDAENIDDLLYFDDDDEFKELFGNDLMLFSNNQLPFINIPISFSYYLTLIDYNLKCIPKDQRNNYFTKNIINVNSSVVVLYKFTSLHKKMWNSFLAKRPENKALIYIRDHFIPKLGIFFEKGGYKNYYSYKIKDKNDDNSKYKDIESTVRIPLLRLGLALQFTWLKDESGIINSSFLISGGFQTNVYKQGCCCCHCKDSNWFDVSSDFYGVNKVGINNYSVNINGFKMKPWYVMFHLEVGFYFIKLFTRFYSPISSSNNTNMSFLDFFRMDNCDIKDKKDNDMKQNETKKLNFDKWTMSWGISLSL